MDYPTASTLTSTAAKERALAHTPFSKTLPKAHGLYDPSLERDACGVGFIADLAIDGSGTHQNLLDALTLLCRLEHRGATGSEANVGDGAGIQCTIPHDFFATILEEEHSVALPPRDNYAVASLFLPKDDAARATVKEMIEGILGQFHLSPICWRKVPVDNSDLGARALATEPQIEQLFVSKPPPGTPRHGDIQSTDFDTILYVARKTLTRLFDSSETSHDVYVCSFSSRVVTYKGQLSAPQLRHYFPDLSDERFSVRAAMVHSRFATNTHPTWERAQPFRTLCHNGEINTMRGNVNWMRGREGVMHSKKFGAHIDKLYPVIEAGVSDSGAFDNCLEFISYSGRRLEEAIMLMVPEAWQNDTLMSPDKRAYYEYHSSLMEPWDGPALLCFSDGNVVGAILDRNGLRPGRYYVSRTERSDRLIFSSEVGVIDVPDDTIVYKGRLQPGRMLLADLRTGEIVDNDTLKSKISSQRPYAEWLSKHKIVLPELNVQPEPFSQTSSGPRIPLMKTLKCFGYSMEELEMLILPMAEMGYETLGSMGTDTPLACLSSQPRHVGEYFKQLFAQVTNPPIDPIRESIVMSLQCPIGPEGNLLSTLDDKACRRVFLKHPIMTPKQFQALLNIDQFTAKFIDMTFPRECDSATVLDAELGRVCAEAEEAVQKDGCAILVLSHLKVDKDRAPISSLLAIGAVHQHLVRKSLRSKVALVAACGDVSVVHQMCLSLGFGVDAIFPYVVYDVFRQCERFAKTGTKHDFDLLVANYQHAATYGIFKVMSKMGISTLQSYKGAQIFEAVGIHQTVIDICFTGCASRIGGVGFDAFAADLLKRHDNAFPLRQVSDVSSQTLPNPGQLYWRNAAEVHLNDPKAIHLLQQSAKNNSKDTYQKYSEIANKLAAKCTLRGQLEFVTGRAGHPAVALDEVEPAAEIVKRFVTGAMSYGSLSLEAHTTLAVAMNRIGGKSNTGEGGEDVDRFKAMDNGDSKRSAIKQVASGRFGVTINYLTNADELQIKMAQGAKPGEGGELPGKKVLPAIAKVRKSTPGVGLISPPPHHDIYSIEDLAQLIFDLKNANRDARVSVKLVSEVGVGVIASGVAKGKADHILISGHDGGTGASRMTGIKHAGLPWELGVAETHQCLVMNGLRDRVVVQTDGQLRTGQDVAKAALLGAEEFGFATAPLITIGCIMMRKCHLNTCPVGVATQDPELRKKFEGSPESVVNFLFLVAEECREIMAKMGFRSMKEMIGRADFLRQKTGDELSSNVSKASTLDFTKLLTAAAPKSIYCWAKQDHQLASVLDQTLLKQCRTTIDTQAPVKIDMKIVNTDRSVGAILSNEISKVHGEDGLPLGSIDVNFTGHAGQSFGAFLAKGVSFSLTGDANDYVGKGCSGGRIAISAPEDARFVAHESIIIGNVAFYGATSGKAFIGGIAAERFCVRNSGIEAVVEGVGDHGCEYMTGGRVVVLGATGRNFAAGMSGGFAYIYDPAKTFPGRCNAELVDLEPLDELKEDADYVRRMVEEHVASTRSARGQEILNDWERAVTRFVRVSPRDYKAAVAKQKEAELKKAVAKAAKSAARIALNVDETVESSGDSSDSSSSSAASSPSLSPTASPRTSFATKAKNEPKVADIESMGGTSEPPLVVGRIETSSSSNGAVSIKKRRKLARRSAKRVVLAIEDDERPGVVDKPVKLGGFKRYARRDAKYREPKKRLEDYAEIGVETPAKTLTTQAARCMNCGVPFCHEETNGCPLGNKIPEWNDLVYRGRWKDAFERLASTNNFPEFTGRVCPAPCEGSCTLGIIEHPVSIKSIENAIIDRAWEEGWLKPSPPTQRTGKSVAVIGSGPAGLACADQLNKAGHRVTLYERENRIGGLLMYGIPNMKLAKERVQRRVDLMAAEGVKMITNTSVGSSPGAASSSSPAASSSSDPSPSAPLSASAAVTTSSSSSSLSPPSTSSSFSSKLSATSLAVEECKASTVDVRQVRAEHDAVCLTVGATVPRDLPIEGRKLKGIHFAMEFLTQNTKSLLNSGASDATSSFVDTDAALISAKGKRVVVIGGGDTGTDCIGTSIRHGCSSLVNFELLPQPAAERKPDNPWPLWPLIMRVDYGHKEAATKFGEDPRQYQLLSEKFVGDENGNVCAIETVRVKWYKDENNRWKFDKLPDTRRTFKADLVLLAMGFTGPEHGVSDPLGIAYDGRSNFDAKYGQYATSVGGVFAAGDCRRGQSLVVRAIAEGRQAAREIDRYLMGSTSLP